MLVISRREGESVELVWPDGRRGSIVVLEHSSRHENVRLRLDLPDLEPFDIAIGELYSSALEFGIEIAREVDIRRTEVGRV